MHRAQQTFNDVFERVQSRMEPKGWHGYKHRRESLSAEQDELPAFSQDEGGDNPAAVDVTGEFRSILTLEFRVIVQAPTLDELHDKLNEARSDIHIAVRQSSSLGFVLWTDYGGAPEPPAISAGSQLTAERVFVWLVLYSMDLDDPN